MSNACFNCKRSIPSGETFCAGCRTTIDLGRYTGDSRMWMVVAGAMALQVVVFVGGLVGYPLVSDISIHMAALAGVVLAWIPGLLLAYALLKDAAHVRRRDDTDWHPSKWTYIAIVWTGVLLVLPGTLLGLYHLHKRNRTIGLPRGR